MTAPATMVADPEALEALIAEVAAQDSYGFDTEFHTERTYVPDLALIQIAWADQVALVDPLAVDPAPLARVFGGPGVAVVHAASQDLDVLMAACGVIPATVFDTQIVAGFLGLSTPSLSRLVDQMLGVSLPKADRLSDWLVRPISERQITYALNDVAYLLELRDVLTERLRALGRLEWALDECAQVLGRPHVRPRPRRGVVEARGHPGHVASLARGGARSGGLARTDGRRVQPAPPHGAVGPGTPRSVAAPAARTATSCAPPAASTDATWPRAAPPPSCGQSSAASSSRRTRSGCPRRGAIRRHPRPQWPCARAWCARSPTTSTSTRASSPRGPTSPNSSAASRAGSIRAGAAPLSATRCAG